MTIYCNIVGGTVVNRATFDGGMPDGWAEIGDAWVADDIAQIGWAYAGGVLSPPPVVPPDAPPLPDPTPYLYATAQIAIAANDISAISVSAKLSGAFRFDVGSYWVFFTDEQPDTQYMALVYDSGSVRSFVAEADKFTTYFVVTTTNFTGAPADPEAINIEIKRVS